METKEGYESKMELRVRLWEDEIIRMEAERWTAPGAVRVHINYRLPVLYEKFAQLRQLLLDLEQADGTNWETLRADVDRLTEDFEHTLNQAVDQVPA